VSQVRLLFVVKFREKYDGSCGYDGTPGSFGGLYYSALFVVQMLRSSGIQAKLVQVCDNNEIDREVAAYKPTVVIIEALWVVPSKFQVLRRLHPGVKWIVRCHSEIPFLAYEGIAMQWLNEYVREPNVSIAANSLYATRDFGSVVGPKYADKVAYLPNYYPAAPAEKKHSDGFLDVGAFGALRPLKNQLIQGLAAIEFARQTGHKLRFHINTRAEQGGDAVVKNLGALFSYAGYPLIMHHWQDRNEFLATLAQTDIGMQVSFSETFDITAADTVTMGIPLVTSREVTWASDHCKAEETNLASIVAKLRLVMSSVKDSLIHTNITRLRLFCNESQSLWKEFTEHEA
jgi:hypothetical protein